MKAASGAAAAGGRTMDYRRRRSIRLDLLPAEARRDIEGIRVSTGRQLQRPRNFLEAIKVVIARLAKRLEPFRVDEVRHRDAVDFVRERLARIAYLISVE